MRNEKTLIGLLRNLAKLLAEETSRNPEFASKLDSLLSELPERKVAAKKSSEKNLPVEIPNIHDEFSIRGDSDFRLWLRELPIPVLRAVIRADDLDATRRTTKWKDAEKLAEFIADSLRARQARGSAFIGRSTNG